MAIDASAIAPTGEQPDSIEVHPDAELLALGAEHQALNAAAYDLADEGGVPEEMWERYDEVGARIMALEAITVEGLAVKLRLMWCWHIEDRVENRHGAQPDSNGRTKMFWSVIQRANAMSRGA